MAPGRLPHRAPVLSTGMAVKKTNDPASNPLFEGYYSSLYGERWQGLRESLLAGAAPVLYAQGLVTPYRMNRASILAARSLRLPEDGTILDACAAPGGKTLVLASRMGDSVELLANEPSAERRRRLHQVLDAHLETTLRRRVTVSGFNAAALGSVRAEHERFSGILLDVPCSSEAHLLQQPRLLAQWSATRPRFLANRQWALLSAAFLLLKSGGSLVYCTCAITQEENDGVAGRLLKKYGAQVILDPMDDLPDSQECHAAAPWGEETAYGRIILPDRCEGIGPMYVARFRKG